MPDRGRSYRGPPWGGHEHGPRFRPPWWPENEPFPPSGTAWRQKRKRFARRVGLMMLLFFALLVLVGALLVTLLSGALGVETRRGLAVPAVILGVLILVLAFGLVARTVRRMARPIGDVMDAADRVAAGDYGVRVEERGWRETRRLARSFNAMAERLATHDEQRRNLLADLAHELRTPLSVIQGSVEAMLDGLHPIQRERLASILDETTVLSRLLDDLRTLSVAEAGALALHRETTEPWQLIEEAIATLLVEADRADVMLEADVPDGLPALDVDPVRIGQVLSNLISNALMHSTAGGTVVVDAAAGPADGEVTFHVRDTGGGTDPSVLPHVFDRFVKSADSGGAGLGLAIARTLVEAHGGRITAESEPGRGTTIRFTLPSLA